MEVDFNYNDVADKATSAIKTWGYECECNVENRGVIAIKVYSRNGVELDSQKNVFRLCATEDLTRSSSGRHRPNYFEWQEGLRKFSSANFWITRRKGYVRGALSDDELARSRQYESSCRGDRSAYTAEYRATHRDEIRAYRESHREEKHEYYEAHQDERLAYQAAYRGSHREEIDAYRASHREEAAVYSAKRRSQLWTNGTETLKWSTLQTRALRKWHMTKADLIAQGWHPVE